MKVSHIILRVSDMDRSVAFYRDRVGLPVLSASPVFTFLDAGSIKLALNATGTEQDSDASLTEIVVEVDDVAARYAAMAERGVPFEVEPREVMRAEGSVLAAAHFRDPDGHLMSITGWITEPE